MVQNVNRITSCYIGPKISPEEFVAEHFFIYLIKGIMHGYDGNKHYSLLPGEYCIVRKNHLARYNKEKENKEFEKVVVTLDEAFLKKFHQRHPITPDSYHSKSAFFLLKKSGLVPHFIHSLTPYYNNSKR